MPIAELDGSAIRVKIDYHERQLMREISGARYNKDDQTWSVPLTWSSCIVLRGVFGDQLEVGPALTRWAWSELNLHIQPSLELREAMTLSAGKLSSGIDAIESGSPLTLNGYQRADVAFMVTARRCLLANPPGLGKTAVSIRTMQLLDHLGETPFPVVVICPNSLKITVWQDEIAKWAPGYMVSVVDGPATKRRKQLTEKADFYIINWESVRLHSRLARYGTVSLTEADKTPKELNDLNPRTVIMDEAHRLAHPRDSKQARAAWAVAHQAEFRYALTGTPVADNASDLWGILHCLDPDSFAAKTKYIDRYCTPPDSPVVMSDGTFSPIGDIRVGDEVLAFDNENVPGGLKLNIARVVSVNKRISDIVRVTTESGTVFRCTPDHEWLDSRRYYKRHHEGAVGAVAKLPWSTPGSWATCECGVTTNAGNMSRHLQAHSEHKIKQHAKPLSNGLRPVPPPKERVLRYGPPTVGHSLVKVTEVPPSLTKEQQEKALWLGGIFDGEGSSRSSIYISQHKKSNPDVYAAIDETLQSLGFKYRANEVGFSLRGGRESLFKFMHYCRPVKRKSIMDGSRYKGLSCQIGRGRFTSDKIISVEPDGRGEVVSLTTTTGTYIVHGYASSNCEVSLNLFGGMEVLGLKAINEEEFRKITDPYWRRVPKEIALPMLPPKLPVQYRLTPMSPSQAKLYHQMEEEAFAQTESGELITATGHLPMLTRLLQFAAATAALNESGDVRLTTPSSKIDDLMELLEEMGDDPLVVAAVSRQLIELAAAKLTEKKIAHGLITGAQSVEERARAVTQFQEGHLRVILLTVGAGSEGITLTRADTILFMQRSWRPIENEQAEARVHRIGSERHSRVRVIEQITPGTVEERKRDVLAGKEIRIEEIIRDKDALRRLLGK